MKVERHEKALGGAPGRFPALGRSYDLLAMGVRAVSRFLVSLTAHGGGRDAQSGRDVQGWGQNIIT